MLFERCLLSTIIVLIIVIFPQKTRYGGQDVLLVGRVHFFYFFDFFILFFIFTFKSGHLIRRDSRFQSPVTHGVTTSQLYRYTDFSFIPSPNV